MSTGVVLLVIVGILAGFGIGQRVLDRLQLTDRQAIFFVGLALIGGLLPDIPLARQISFNIGGTLVPVGLSVYLLIKADSAWEVFRTLLAALLASAAIYWMGRLLPGDPESAYMDYNYLYGVVCGLIAYLFGRSRRGAFVAGVLGAVLSDVFSAMDVWRQGVEQPLLLGGAGAADVIVISGLTAVLLAELLGEIIERFVRGRSSRRDEVFDEGQFRERSREGE